MGRPKNDFPGAPVASYRDHEIADSPYNDRMPIVLGPNMNPASVSAAMSQANLGYMNRWCDLLDECREKIPALHTALAQRELAISGCRWVVKPANQSRTALRIAAEQTERIKKIEGFSTAIKHLSGGIFFGRSATEIVWKRDRDGIWPKELPGIMPKRISLASNWRPHLWDASGNEYSNELQKFPGVDLEATYKDKVIIHTPSTMGAAIPTRQGIGRVCVFYCLFYGWTWREWMKFAELFGQPWRVAFFDKGADPEDIASAKLAIKMMSSNGAATLPGTTKFELHQPSGNNHVYSELHSALDNIITKIVLHTTLTTSSPTNGTQALGKVHKSSDEDRLADDGKALSETIQKWLIEPMTLKNYGIAAAEKHMPTFELVTSSEEDVNDSFTRTMGLVDRGMPVTAGEARAAYTSLPPLPPELESIQLHPESRIATDAPQANAEKLTKTPEDLVNEAADAATSDGEEQKP